MYGSYWVRLITAGDLRFSKAIGTLFALDINPRVECKGMKNEWLPIIHGFKVRS